VIILAIEDYYKPLIIQRKTLSGNGMGGSSETWVTHLSIDGLINQASSSEIYIAGKLDIKVTHKLFCPPGLDITNKDRVLYNSKIYRIVGEPKDTVNRGHHFVMMLEYLGGVDNGL